MNEIDNNIKRNICILWQCFYPWDIRLEKFITTLNQYYSIYLISRGKTNTPKEERMENLKILRVFVNGFLGKFLVFPIIFSPPWIIKSCVLLIQKKFSLILVRDLPLMWLGIFLKFIFKIPLVFDMAENYPAALLAYEKKIYKPFLFGNAFLPRIYERISVKLSDHIIVVTEEQKDRLIKFNVPAKKISVVSNTPILEKLDKQVAQKGVNGEKIILYTGKIDAHRGVETAIRAMPKIINSFSDTKLILAGEGTELKSLKILAKYLGLKNHVLFLGWISHKEIYDNICRSTVCLIPHLKSEHTDTTLPNKLFDYMALGKPVVSSDLVPVTRIITDYKCGMIFKNNDYELLSEMIIWLFRNGSGVPLGMNGRKAVIERFNWNEDSGNLRKIFFTLIKN